MEKTEKNKNLQYIIDRYDNFCVSINSKGNLYLAVSTFILGGIIAGYFTLDKQYHFGCGVNMLFIFTLIANIGAIICTLFAITPYMNNKKDNAKGSLIYFGDVADYHEDHYQKMWTELDDDQWHEDLKKQAQLLASGLSKKFKRLHCATWFIIAQVVLVVVFGIIILYNF
jgi:hypothetical protein